MNLSAEEKMEIAALVAEIERPSPSQLMSRYVAIAGGIVAIAGTGVAAVGFAVTLQMGVSRLQDDVGEMRVELKDMRTTMQELGADRWTRSHHDRWERETFVPLEARVRVLEQKHGAP